MVEKIAIGTVQFGLNYGISNSAGQTSLEEVQKILLIARNNAIDTIDTAKAYGESENILGTAGCSDFKIISKFIHTETREQLESQLQQSLKALRVNKLHGYLAHRTEDIIRNPEIWATLKKLKEENKISKIGFSFNTVQEYESAISNQFIPDIVQVPYNYFDNRFEKAIQTLKEDYNTEIHVRSAFLQGLFFMNTNQLADFFQPVKSILENIQNEHLPAQLLYHVAKNKNVDKVVTGLNDSYQLIQNIAQLQTNFPPLPDQSFNLPEHIITPSLWKK